MRPELLFFGQLALVLILVVAWARVFALALTEEKPEDKIIWSLVVFFGGPLGLLMYLMIRWPVLKREQRQRDADMLRQMRDDFGKSPAASTKS